MGKHHHHHHHDYLFDKDCYHHDHHHHDHYGHDHHHKHHEEKHHHHKHHDKKHHHHHHEDPNKFALYCGRGISTRLDQNMNRAEVAFFEIDTANLVNPTLKIDFTTMIDTITVVSPNMPLDVELNVRFRLVRENALGIRVVLGDWLYRRDRNTRSIPQMNFEISQSQSFSFTYCDYITCPSCYVYKVIAVLEAGGEVDRTEIMSPAINAVVRY